MEGGDGERALALEGFRVRMYRSIRDSGFVPVFPLTSLVGREQAGKTALLQALHGLGQERDSYSLERDWPRGRRGQSAAEQVVCSASFRLGSEARRELYAAGLIGPGVSGLRVGRTYADALVAEAWRPVETDPRSASSRRIANSGKLATFAAEHLPAFLYAGSDALLPGAIPVEWLDQPGPREQENGTAALARLLFTAGLQRQELRGELGSRRVRELGLKVRERILASVTARRLVLDAERGRLLAFLETNGSRTPMDRVPSEARYELTLALRLAALEPDGRSGTVLLLDGPGRLFRRAGSARMRILFDEHVRSGATVLYTARLPFDVELQHSEQVLVLAPARHGSMVARDASAPEQQLALRAALGMTGRGSFRVDDMNLVVEGRSDATLLAALDTLLRRSGETGLPPATTLTSAQGSHEVVAVSKFLGLQGLGVIALLDSDGAGRSARDELERIAREDERMERVEVLLLGEAAGIEVPNAAIENLLPGELYVEVAREVCERDAAALISRALASNGERSGGHPAARLTRAFESEGRRFPKAKIAEALGATLAAMESVSELPQDCIKAVRSLMGALRSAAGRLYATHEPQR